MSGDYTRFTHDPEKHYNRVLMQQGRLQLDADWNEFADIIQDRLRKQAIDTFGRVAVSRFSTPSAFRVSVSGTNLALAPGRMYVDGLVAEILPSHSWTYANQPFYPAPTVLTSLAGNALVYLDVWEREVTCTEDPELLEPALGGPDTTTRIQTVWQMKVHALGTAEATCNPDFSKLFPPSAGRLSTRAVNPPATTDPCILAPSGGYRGLENQLYRVEIHTPGGIGTAKFKWSRDNASIVSSVQQITSVGGGSQLTVSRIGRDRVLRFKVNDWAEITDDRRELMGEAGEMARVVSLDEAAQTILLDRTIPTTGGRAFGANTAELQTLHTRIRRWDQQTDTDTNGLLTVTNNWPPLEDGVEIDFSLAGSLTGTGSFKVGDYWVFAARTANASVESLTKDPARGIKHHYAALETLSGLPTTPTIQSDCRPIWFSEGGQGGCCTVIVRPGERIQVAIDSLPFAGGCVCLKPGIHPITEPIKITRSNITLQGETLGARVILQDGVNLLAIAGTLDLKIQNIIIENIHFEASGKATEKTFQQVSPDDLFDNALISLYQCQDVVVRQCEIEAISSETPASGTIIPFRSIGIFVLESTQINLYTNQLRSTTVGIWSESSTNLLIIQNSLLGITFLIQKVNIPLSLVGILVDYKFPGEPVSPERVRNNETCIIERNQIESLWIGIFIGTRAVESCIVGNKVLRPSLRGLDFPVNAIFQILSPFLLATETFIYGIVSLAPSCTIANNHITLNYGAYGGIRVLGEQTHVASNWLTGNAIPVKFSSGTVSSTIDLLPVGITISGTIDERFKNRRPSYSAARNNTLKGSFSSGIWVIGVENVRVLENHIKADSDVILTFGISVFLAQNTYISENQIKNIQGAAISLNSTIKTQVIKNYLSSGLWGILAVNDSSLEIIQNDIENMKFAGIAGGNLRELTTITQTQIISCGYAPPKDTGIGAGIFIFNDPADPTVGVNVGSLRVESCEILNTGISLDGETINPKVNYGLGAGSLRSCHISSNRIIYSDKYLTNRQSFDLNQESRALLISGTPTQQPSGSGRDVPIDIPIETDTGSAIITENLFGGVGFSHLVEIKTPRSEIPSPFVDLRFKNVSFNNNTCQHLVNEKKTDKQAATVALWASHLIVMGNHIKVSRRNYPSINLNDASQVVFMGNITQGDWLNPGTHIPTPATNFNTLLP